MAANRGKIRSCAYRPDPIWRGRRKRYSGGLYRRCRSHSRRRAGVRRLCRARHRPGVHNRRRRPHRRRRLQFLFDQHDFLGRSSGCLPCPSARIKRSRPLGSIAKASPARILRIRRRAGRTKGGIGQPRDQTRRSIAPSAEGPLHSSRRWRTGPQFYASATPS